MKELITALLAPIAGGRRYWVAAPQKLSDGNPPAKPYLVLNRIDGIIDYHTQGPSGLVESRLQVDVYDVTRWGAEVTVRQVKAILSGYRNGAIRGAFINDERDLPASDAGDVTQLFRISLDLTIHHTE
ncbi:DUF3168 domain-containing protein [Mesorhizobium xinjiangense]|uniref:DUF3168 domain-containing protein n=1 Tax=Mesorhizobium xinjiangense TaxID=2678685 RepID=UPI0012EE5D38|nr:DUF3168 domain-containing protein [Mesorhizobium xinjiangense]